MKKIIEWFKTWWSVGLAADSPTVAPAPAVPLAKAPLKISPELLAMIEAAGKVERKKFDVKRPVLPPGVLPADIKSDTAYMALDSSLNSIYDYAGQAHIGLGFPGYPYLSELAQRSEFRSPTETTATEMTRKWIRITSKGDGDHSKKIEAINEAFETHKIQDVFRLAAVHDGFFGRGQIYIMLKDVNDDARKLPLVIAKETIKKGSLLGFKNVEPIWTTPYAYNSNDPLAPDFFKPTSWFIMGKQTHATRLLTFVAREVPDMLKPAYNFGGISMSQLMEPYVDNWLRTRDSVSELLHSFSISGIKTDLATTLSGGSGDDLFARMELFNKIRDNRGLMAIDMEKEEFFQFNTPLSGIDALQAQAQEQMAAPCHTPLVKLLGVTPQGLNASSEGEIEVYKDYIRSQQELQFKENLNRVLKVVQLDLFGEIDPAIGYEYESLKELDGEALARVRKSDADAAIAYITANVLSVEEERLRLASDPNSGYNSLEAEKLPPREENPDDEKHAGGLSDDGKED